MSAQCSALVVWCISALVWCMYGVYGVTEIKIGVVLISDRNIVYGYHRVAPAIDMAVERVNNDILNSSYRLVTVMRSYGPECDGSEAPGRVTCLYLFIYYNAQWCTLYSIPSKSVCPSSRDSGIKVNLKYISL